MHSYISTPNTGWKDIYKLEPGSLLIWKHEKFGIHRYFSADPPKTDDFKTSSDREAELFSRLNKSVQAVADSDRPLGMFLSGGLDSSTVACLLSKQRGPFPVFSIEWADEAYSEKEYAAEIAGYLNLPHTIIECTPHFFQENFEKIVDLYDEPFADESMIPTFCIAQEAKKQVDVVLTGDGADEFFHGYERYFFDGNFETYLDLFSSMTEVVSQSIFSKDFISKTEKKASSWLKNHLNQEDLRMRSWIDIYTYLPDDILTKVDRATMAVSLEARAPFLMPNITEFALGCTLDELIRIPNEGKSILRAAMQQHLPSRILKRKKMGFGVPLHRWFSSSLKDWMKIRLLEGSLIQTGWFSFEGIQKMIDNHNRGISNHSRTLLNLLVLEHWLKREAKKN